MGLLCPRIKAKNEKTITKVSPRVDWACFTIKRGRHPFSFRLQKSHQSLLLLTRDKEGGSPNSIHQDFCFTNIMH